MNDTLVLENIKNGDKSQLDAIYNNYKPEFISWIIRQYRCDNDEAEEFYQYAVVTFYDNIVSKKLTKLECSIKTYLFAIGRNKFLEKRKSNQRFMPNINNLDITSIPEVQDYDLDIRERQLQCVESSLEQLGEPCRTLLELYYFHNKSMDDIAELLNYKNRDTSKNLKYKCLNRLKKIFKEGINKLEEQPDE